jgi:hypothetical protein
MLRLVAPFSVPLFALRASPCNMDATWLVHVSVADFFIRTPSP